MTREDQAGSLGRWLERAPGSPPPDDVEADVIEAIYALRPDLAPAPRLTADDILASVTRGPLADPASAGNASDRPDDGAEVVPFPVRRVAAPEVVSDEVTPAPAGRRGTLWMWVGGTGGLGMALVAAATILLVATPVLQDAAERQAEEMGSPAASTPPASETVLAEELSAPADAPLAAATRNETPPARPPTPQEPVDEARASARSVAVQSENGEVATGQVFDMQDGALYREPTVIAEAEEQRELDAVADLDGEGAAPPSAAPAQDLAKAAAPVGGESKADRSGDLDALREKAEPKSRDGSSWRKLVDADVLARIDAGIAQADNLRATGSFQAAGDALAAVVQPPARAGQHIATLAARDYLAAGNAQAAAGVAQRGIGLSSASSPERSGLLVAYGDALRALGDADAAADMYKQAR